MVDSICQSFLNSGIRKIEIPHSFCSIRKLGYSLFDYIVPYVRKSIRQLTIKRSCEYAFSHSNTRGIRFIDNLDSRIREEIIWPFGKEHQTDINRLPEF